MSRSSVTMLCILIIIPLALNATDLQSQLLNKEQQTTNRFNGNIQNLLIHPSKNMFEVFIFPYLSQKGVLQIYDYLKNLYPNLDLPTFLETYHVESNIVWGLEEEYIFYPLLGNQIFQGLYSKKTKIPIIFETLLSPNPHRDDDVLALLPSKKIIPFQFRSFFSRPRHGLIFAQNPYGYSPIESILQTINGDIPRRPPGHDFFIALLKENGKFSVVAHGAAYEVDICKNIHLIWEAYTSKYTTLSLKFSRTVTIPYLRYLHFCDVCLNNVYQNNCTLPILWVLARILGFGYHVQMLPFHLLALFIELLNSNYNTPFYTFIWNASILSFFLFTIVTWRFINIVERNLWGQFYVFCFGNCLCFNYNYPQLLDIFVIKPYKLMWRFPILMQKENPETYSQKFCSIVSLLLYHLYIWLIIAALASMCKGAYGEYEID